jgi:ferritin-like protein
MSSENLHVPRESLSAETLHLHYAIVSLMEELEAVDWYRQRADDTKDENLKAVLLHNAREEIEHASMVLEWIRRQEPVFDKNLREYLFSEGPITEVEHQAMGRP